jgi:hypothetical protein
LGFEKGAITISYAGYDRLEGFEEQSLLAAVYKPLALLFNFFMPTHEKPESKTRVGSEEIQVYDEPRSPYQWLMECPELPQECKESSEKRSTLFTVRWNFSGMCYKVILRQRLIWPNRKNTQEQG